MRLPLTLLPSSRLATWHASQKRAPSGGWRFDLGQMPGAYDASSDRTAIYDLPRMRAAAPAIWRQWGPLFKRIGAELGVDPRALAAYAMFESYDHRVANLNPRMLDRHGTMVAAGLTATQAQLWKGKRIPGLDRHFPPTTEATAEALRARPELGVRVLASLMKGAYEATGNLARAFPRTAYPAWGDPGIVRGAYGHQAQYASRAFALYRAFVEADR